jgi:hypothetical protein
MDLYLQFPDIGHSGSVQRLKGALQDIQDNISVTSTGCASRVKTDQNRQLTVDGV